MTTNPTTDSTTTDGNGTAASARGEANIWPAFRYRDAKAAIAFLRSAFGFEVTAEYTNPDDPGLVDHAELTWPGGEGSCSGPPATTGA